MFKGFCFFMKFGWHSDKRYVIYHILHQCIRSMIPIVSVIMPKYIIDALSAPQHMEYFEIYQKRTGDLHGVCHPVLFNPQCMCAYFDHGACFVMFKNLRSAIFVFSVKIVGLINFYAF